MILIIGCGRLGGSLAVRLTNAGHEVVVLDHLRENLHTNLPRNFRGKTVCGMEIDSNVLKRSGIERAQSVVCVSRDENTNMMAADVARSVYRVQNIIVRIDQQDYAEAYRQYGFDIISPILEATGSLERALRRQRGEEG